MESTQILPPTSTISSASLSFLNHRFRTGEDLNDSAHLVSDLIKQCRDLDTNVSDLNLRLQSSLAAYALFSNRSGVLFNDINARLTDLHLLTRASASSPDGGADETNTGERILGEELPALAKEVARVETVRIYSETALKLDTLVGDVEDAVSSTMKKYLRKSYTQNLEEMRFVAIKTLKQIEDLLASIRMTRPQWSRLVSAVDDRVDHALGILRPQAISDHRALLASIGWPPPLSSLTSSNPDTGRSAKIVNPLFTMQGDLKDQYCENFLALCSLQELQRRRKSQQLEGYNRKVALHQPLWAIEELVNPISIASQHHFSKWVDKPEFIFALVYKITRDYVDSMDELLQPLVDEAMLVGYSCVEEWISSMVTSLVTFLAKEIFPICVGQLDEAMVAGSQSQARISWLHLIDLMIAFDKRIRSLVEESGILVSFEDDSLQKISSLSVFCDRPDWLDLWAEIELNDTLNKLKSETDDERNWTLKIQGGGLLFGPEDHKSPAVSSAFLRHLSIVVDHCRSLPSIYLRSRFLRKAGTPVIQKFLDCIFLRCQEAEGMTALTDNDGLIKVANSINAAHYVGLVLKEWCEDVFFLEMSLGESDEQGVSTSENSSIFDEEIEKFEEFRTEWVEKISVVVLRGFDARCRDYMKNRKQWQEKSDEGWTVSKSIVGALDYLQGKMSVIEGSLNGMDFVGVWRSLASGIDRLFFNGILMSNMKFSDSGVERFGSDLEVLFGVFRAWSLRPEGFFPKTSEGFRLLKMGQTQLKDSIEGREKWMKENGVRNLNVAEAEKIAKSRIFMR